MNASLFRNLMRLCCFRSTLPCSAFAVGGRDCSIDMCLQRSQLQSAWLARCILSSRRRLVSCTCGKQQLQSAARRTDQRTDSWRGKTGRTIRCRLWNSAAGQSPSCARSGCWDHSAVHIGVSGMCCGPCCSRRTSRCHRWRNCERDTRFTGCRQLPDSRCAAWSRSQSCWHDCSPWCRVENARQRSNLAARHQSRRRGAELSSLPGARCLWQRQQPR